MLKYYWNPALFLFGTICIFIFTFWSLYGVVPGFNGVSMLAKPFYAVFCLGAFVWFFCYFFISWSVGIIQLGYAFWQRKTNPNIKHLFAAPLIVSAIYAFCFIMFYMGFYPDA